MLSDLEGRTQRRRGARELILTLLQLLHAVDGVFGAASPDELSNGETPISVRVLEALGHRRVGERDGCTAGRGNGKKKNGYARRRCAAGRSSILRPGCRTACCSIRANPRRRRRACSRCRSAWDAKRVRDEAVQPRGDETQLGTHPKLVLLPPFLGFCFASPKRQSS